MKIILPFLLMASVASEHGTTITHEGVTDSQLHDEYSGFRIFAKDPSQHNDEHTHNWKLRKVQFFSDDTCQGSALIDPGAGFSNPENSSANLKDLFDSEEDVSGVLVLKPTARKHYWVGYTSAAPSKLGCVLIQQNSGQSMNEIEIHVLDTRDDNYIKLYTIKADEGEDLATQRSHFQLRVSWPSPINPSICADHIGQFVMPNGRRVTCAQALTSGNLCNREFVIEKCPVSCDVSCPSTSPPTSSPEGDTCKDHIGQFNMPNGRRVTCAQALTSPNLCNREFVIAKCPVSCDVCPSTSPSILPSDEPSILPSDEPSILPSDEPTSISEIPSFLPSDEPSIFPSSEPSILPSDEPSISPSNEPSVLPSALPSYSPSTSPSGLPSSSPSISQSPSTFPSTTYPSKSGKGGGKGVDKGGGKGGGKGGSKGGGKGGGKGGCKGGGKEGSNACDGKSSKSSKSDKSREATTNSPTISISTLPSDAAVSAQIMASTSSAGKAFGATSIALVLVTLFLV